MMRKLHLFLALGLAGLTVSTTCVEAETETAALECSKSATFLAPLDAPDHRKYAPDLEVQALHLAIEVTPDFKRRTIESEATIRFTPVAKAVQEIKLDAINLDVHSVTATKKIQAWQATDENLLVTFPECAPP